MQAIKKMEINKNFLIVIFGKDECPHCDALYENVVNILDENSKEDFSLDFQNLSRREGLVAFAKAETVNGQRIPALQILKFDKNDKSYKKIVDSRKEEYLTDENKYFYPTYLQLQTDYANKKDITQEEILDLMDLARNRYE
jgi:thiol-disulfide isomerase/thioredoxin